MIGNSPGGVSLTDAAEHATLPVSTALRQLRSLEAAGLVCRAADSQLYRPGPELIRLAHTVINSTPLAALAQPHLDALAAATKESCYLAVARDSRNAVYIATSPGTHQLRHNGWLDTPVPRRNTAVGAALDENAIAAHERDNGVESGVTAISCPVVGVDGKVAAAISIVGPSFRFTLAVRKSATKHLIAHATSLSHAIGTPGPPD